MSESLHPRMTTSRLLAAYAGDIRFELTKMLRTPAFAVPTLVFPAMFYLLFGVLLARGDPAVGISTFARLGVFGTMAPGLFGFGVSLAFEREYGLLRFKQALPMPTGAYLIARMSMAMLFAAIISVLLATIALTVAHAPITLGQLAQVFLVQILGVLPFCAIGLCVGASVSGQAAPAIINLIYLPMAFLSGLWVPLQFLPKVIQDTAPLWPSNHLAQLALGALDQPTVGSTGSHVVALAGITVLFFWFALRQLGNRGVRIIGGDKPGTATALRRVTGMAVPALAIFGIVLGVMGAKTPVVAKPAASEAAPGTPAPADGLVADFDGGTEKAAYGVGFTDADDKRIGGDSTASVKVIDGGAEGSKGALEVTGSVRPGFAYPFSGAGFYPLEPAFEGMMDYTKFKTLSFFVRGDGKRYEVRFFSTAASNMPSPTPFEAGPEWREVRVTLADGVVDLSRVRAIQFVDAREGEDFRFEIDNIRFL